MALTRMKNDGSGPERIIDTPINDKFGVSPDGDWVIVSAAGHGANVSAETVAVPIHGGASRKLCDDYCPGGWSPDGRVLYIGGTDTLTIPVPAGKSMPDLPAAGLRSAAGWAELPGVKVIALPPSTYVSPGPNFSFYVFSKTDLQRNLFRIPLH
jgi:hypothetical protein